MSPDSATDTVLVYRRHFDPATLAVAGMTPCTTQLGTDPIAKVAALYEQGARHITLPEPVDLSPAADPERAVSILVALREMAARAIAVDWRLHLGSSPSSGSGEGTDAEGPDEAVSPDAAFVNMISHLNPPRQISGVRDAETLLAAWRSGFFFNACIHRRAPGFIQVRDWRGGQLSRITIDDPDYLAVFNAIQHPAPAAGLPEEILSDFEAENLVGRVEDYVWWVPCQVRRWPVPAMNL
jgi:hypothetical protein